MGLSAKRRIVIIGPHGAGKTSLAKALLEQFESNFSFEIERIVTDRQRRHGEDDSEYEFVSPEQFAAHRPSYLYVQLNRGVAWSYALKQDSPVSENTLRLYVVIPETAEFLQEHFSGETVIIGILPASNDVLRKRLIDRDPDITADELQIRLDHIDYDIRKVHELSDAVFYNKDDIATAATKLRQTIEKLLQE